MTVGAAPTVLASFAASLVECIEALTIVLAVGVVRGWRWALAGSAAALSLLVVLVAMFGASIERIPLPLVQVTVGALLLLFGLRWLRKAILRSGGVIALHDEEESYAKATAALRGVAGLSSRWDSMAFATAFKIAMLEGVEVVFIVIAMGAGGPLIVPASLGAAAALGVVVCLGVALHRPLAKIPENTLKFAVGVLLSAFGSFWVGEGIHVEWPAADSSLVALIALYFVVALALVRVVRSRFRPSDRRSKAPGSSPHQSLLVRFCRELLSLFVDDPALAAGTLAWITLAWWTAPRLSGSPFLDSGLFVAGFAGVLIYSVLHAARN
jgi:uncharacterized membrane protein